MIALSEIIRDVKKVMNEAGDEEEAVLITEDKVNLDLYIEDAISSAVAFVQKVSPIKGVNLASSKASPVKNEDGTGHVLCPSDYVCLVGFKMSRWSRVCVVAYPEGSEMWAQQMNSYTRSGPNKPCCIEGHDQDGNRIISYFSVPSGQEHTISLFIYEASFDKEKGLNCSNDFIYKSVVFKTASIVYDIFQDINTSQAMEKESLNYLNINQVQ